MITCQQCGNENPTTRCESCGHRTVFEQDIKDVRIYLDKAMKMKKEQFPNLVKKGGKSSDSDINGMDENDRDEKDKS